MITGFVSARVARIRLRIPGANGRSREIEAVIDTGYSGWLTLPPKLIVALGLSWQTTGRGLLADGSECLFDVYDASVIWGRRVRRILVDEAAEPVVLKPGESCSLSAV